MERNERLAVFGMSVSASMLMICLTSWLTQVNRVYQRDVNGDGKYDLVIESGYSFYPKYELFIQGPNGEFVRDGSLSREYISSKIK